MSKASEARLKQGGHNHTTTYHPVTGKLYHPGCPACEKNVKFIQGTLKALDTGDKELSKQVLAEYLREDVQ
jgi:hypothetical protein